MTIQQLKYFHLLANNLHLISTARELMVSPPAITASINRLEQELGVVLFERKGRNLILTNEGKVFKTHVESILVTLEKAKKQMENKTGSMENPLSIGVVSSLPWRSLIEEFSVKNTKIKAVTTLLTLPMLRKNEIKIGDFDFIFCNTDLLDHPSFDSYVLPMNTQPCLAVYRSHHFADRNSISLIEAKNERFITMNSEYCLRLQFDKLCSLAGFKPNIIMECVSQMWSALLKAEYGILVTTKDIEELNILGDVRYIDIVNPQYYWTNSFYINKNSIVDPAAAAFRDFVLNHYGIQQ